MVKVKNRWVIEWQVFKTQEKQNKKEEGKEKSNFFNIYKVVDCWVVFQDLRETK